MGNLGSGYDANDLPEGGSYDLVPAGWYSAKITESELMDTKAGTGQYIKLRLDITGPEHVGRCVWANINIRNPSAKAEEIGQRQLGEIMRAIGRASVSDTDELIGGELSIKVAIRKSKEGDGYGDQNDVRGYKAIDGSSSKGSAKKDKKKDKKKGKKKDKNARAKPPWERG